MVRSWRAVVGDGTNSGDRERRPGKKKKNRCEKLGVWAMARHEKWHGKTVL